MLVRSFRAPLVRATVAVALALLCAAALLAVAGPASATTRRLHGAITSTVQHRDGSIAVTGWAYDRAAPDRSLMVCLVVRHRCVRTARAYRSSRALDRTRHLTGGHRLAVLVRPQPPGVRIGLRVVDRRYAHVHLLAERRVVTAGQRVVTIARRYVGHARYTEGGSSPRTGFDCSGYTRYAFLHAGVARLPHNAQAQRYASHMRRITRTHALPGDLVFYLSGGAAYHEAIYAGRGMQYAAATPRDGIRYQRVWSSRVEYRTDWH